MKTMPLSAFLEKEQPQDRKSRASPTNTQIKEPASSIRLLLLLRACDLCPSRTRRGLLQPRLHRAQGEGGRGEEEQEENLCIASIDLECACNHEIVLTCRLCFSHCASLLHNSTTTTTTTNTTSTTCIIRVMSALTQYAPCTLAKRHISA